MDRVYGQAVRMIASELSLVQEALQVMEGQGEPAWFTDRWRNCCRIWIQRLLIGNTVRPR